VAHGCCSGVDFYADSIAEKRVCGTGGSVEKIGGLYEQEIFFGSVICNYLHSGFFPNADCSDAGGIRIAEAGRQQ
jgi:hypothetical protein